MCRRHLKLLGLKPCAAGGREADSLAVGGDQVARWRAHRSGQHLYLYGRLALGLGALGQNAVTAVDQTAPRPDGRQDGPEPSLGRFRGHPRCPPGPYDTLSSRPVTP